MNQDIRDILYALDDMKKQIADMHAIIVKETKRKRTRSPSPSPSSRRRAKEENTLILLGPVLREFSVHDLTTIFNEYGTVLKCAKPWKLQRSDVWMSKIVFNTREAMEKCFSNVSVIANDYKIRVEMPTKQ
jgi:hypothetical protein